MVKLSSLAFTACYLAISWCIPAAPEAATFQISNQNPIIRMSGEIRAGDATQFAEALARIKARFPEKIETSSDVWLFLASSGGSIAAAVPFAERVRSEGVTTIVGSEDTCASACALIFAAGTSRIASETAQIAVHSVGTYDKADATSEGVEDLGALAVTTRLARIMRSYGTPEQIIGKLVVTAHDDITTLSLSDLRSWDVQLMPRPIGETTPMMPAINERSVSALPARPVQQEPIVWSENVLRVVTWFTTQPWDDKVMYIRGKGSTFRRDCSTPTCRFIADYTGTMARITLYVEEAGAGQNPRRVWCVSDPNAHLRSCYHQQGSRGWVQRYNSATQVWASIE
jgi:hypothetical protein